jgi:hypothetical protein
MRIKIADAIRILNNIQRNGVKYIDIELLKYFLYPKINELSDVVTVIEDMLNKGKSECTISEFNRKTTKSRVTVYKWIDVGLLILQNGKIQIDTSLQELKTLKKYKP